MKHTYFKYHENLEIVCNFKENMDNEDRRETRIQQKKLYIEAKEKDVPKPGKYFQNVTCFKWGKKSYVSW